MNELLVRIIENRKDTRNLMGKIATGDSVGKVVFFKHSQGLSASKMVIITEYTDKGNFLLANRWESLRRNNEDFSTTEIELSQTDKVLLERLNARVANSTGERWKLYVENVVNQTCEIPKRVNSLIEVPLLALKAKVGGNKAFDALLNKLHENLEINSDVISDALLELFVKAEEIFKNGGDNYEIMNSREFSIFYDLVTSLIITGEWPNSKKSACVSRNRMKDTWDIDERLAD